MRRFPRLLLACALLSSVAVVGGRADAQEQGPEPPPEGVDPNGRIERPEELPEGISHPERWRYVPEGRLIEGNIFDRFFTSTFIAPIIFREPDVGFGGGVALTDIDFRNQRRKEFANILASVSTEGQQAYRINWRRWINHIDLEDGGIIQDERSYWAARAGYERTLTRRFFGFGSETTPADETSYTDEVVEVRFSRNLTIPEPAADWIGSIGTSFEWHNLAYGKVSDVPSTDQAFPVLFDNGDRLALLWLTAGIQWNTRDSLHLPYRGTQVGVDASFTPWQSDGDIGARLRMTGSQVFPIPSPFHNGGDGDEENPPTDSIAIGGFVDATAGDLPFYSLPTLGGSRTLRGYINNRWTDRAAWHASAEWRFWFLPRGFLRIERVGAALFYDIGSVAPRIQDFGRAKVLDSYGFGLRMTLERLAMFRFDVGFSEDDTNFSISYGLPF